MGPSAASGPLNGARSATTTEEPLAAAVPLVDEVRRGAGPRDGFSHFNVWAVKHRGRAVGRAISALAGPGALPALVHCTAGKDRTGIVIAVVHALLGVPDAVIAEDYALSAERLRVNTEEALEKQRIALGVDVRERPELLEARPEWILGGLEWIRANHGTVRDYLIAHGVAPGDLDRLRAALIQNERAEAA